MKLPKLNWIVVAVVVCLTASLLYVGYSEWQLRVIQNPLREKLAQVTGVASVQVQTRQQPNVLVIAVEPQADFPWVAGQVRIIVGQEAPRDTSELVWEDNPNEHLLAVRKQLNLVLQEARWRYQFALLQERLEEITQAEAISYQLGVDEEYIYLSLLDDTHALREAIPLVQLGGVAK